MTDRTSPGGFRSLGEIIADGVPTLSWLTDPIFTSDALGMIGALPKCFKSWMLADLVLATTTGVPWLGAFKTHRPGPVLLVSPGVWA